MTIVNQTGVRVIHVAHEHHQLPDEVRLWLRKANNSAYASPDIYDTLALLAKGKKPQAIIIAIDAVDWNELDFFDLSRRLSPQTNIYVTGNQNQQEKIDAACARGAKCFDPNRFDEDISKKITTPPDYGMGGLLAGSLRTTGTEYKPSDTPKPVKKDDRASVPTKADENGSAQSAVVQLVTQKEHDQVTNKTIPFPWAPSPDRPQRTPPKPSPTPVAREDDATTDQKQKPQDVELTTEELAALMGEPLDKENDSYKEQSQ
ncbi:MAG: hypothetical protein ACYTF1_06155 [Planctomycetota bacterium]|jgi:DNA-binding NarL/FixJ family response regulator